jgi:predicted peroxiredoxin
MNKKLRKKENLRTRLYAIVDIYMKQKGKGKRKQLNEFIEQKISKIKLFSCNLSIKKGGTPKKEKSEIDNLKNAQVSVFTLANELHRHTNNKQEVKDAVTS